MALVRRAHDEIGEIADLSKITERAPCPLRISIPRGDAKVAWRSMTDLISRSMKRIEFQIEDVAKRNPKAKGARPEEFVNLALLKELDQSGFIDKLYKKCFRHGIAAGKISCFRSRGAV